MTKEIFFCSVPAIRSLKCSTHKNQNARIVSWRDFRILHVDVSSKIRRHSDSQEHLCRHQRKYPCSVRIQKKGPSTLSASPVISCFSRKNLNSSSIVVFLHFSKRNLNLASIIRVLFEELKFFVSTSCLNPESSYHHQFPFPQRSFGSIAIQQLCISSANKSIVLFSDKSEKKLHYLTLLFPPAPNHITVLV